MSKKFKNVKFGVLKGKMVTLRISNNNKTDFHLSRTQKTSLRILTFLELN